MTQALSQPTYNRRRTKRRALASLGVTEKRPRSGNNVSHAHNKTKRKFRPNLQRAKVMVDGKLVSVRIPASEIRKLSKVPKERKPVKPKHATTKFAALKAKKKAAPKATAKPSAKKS
ncbi:50S ribosomal protein L28 [Patescibacteria group bacterium]|nr:50S ribosomal protein L28 [Patescibacteria group bacterium]